MFVLLACNALAAQPAEVERDRELRHGFELALRDDPEAALKVLPVVIEQPWAGDVSFRDACALAREALRRSQESAVLAERLMLTTGLQNPALAMREFACYLPLVNGPRLFTRFVQASPGEAVALAAGSPELVKAIEASISGTSPPEFAILLRLAVEPTIDLPRRQRLAVLAGRIARGELSFEAALKIAGDSPRFFAEAVDMRAAGGVEVAGLDRVLENESLVLCRAANENVNRAIASDLSRLRGRDLYVMLSLGRAEVTPEVFAAVFDRMLAQRWSAETNRPVMALLDQSNNWGLRDFAAGALAARRFDRLLALAGSDLIARLTRGIELAGDPLKEGMRISEIVDAISNHALLGRMRELVSVEWRRCNETGDRRCSTIYGLLAAKLGEDAIGKRYRAYMESSATLDTAVIFGAANDCIQRHFFYDDEDGVKSFESFLRTYRDDRAWEIEDAGTYVHMTGHGPVGKRTEIFANVPIDGHLAKNRLLEGESERRQEIISKVMEQRGLVATVIVHRGHSFWVERTIGRIQSSARLVILGSCGGTTVVHRVIDAAHESQVIATRGIAGTALNDALLKAVNDRLLMGEQVIQWSQFWRELSAREGKGGLFREYVAPHQDARTVFLRAYYRFMDS
jgi:hypothetical protein